MKSKLNKILNNKNAKIVIPAIVLLVIIIVLVIYLKEYQYNNYRNKLEHNFYQYFSGEKIEYVSTVSLNKKNVIKGFVPKNLQINYESIPIYYKDEIKVIFPSKMSIIFPLKNKTQFKLPEFSYIEKVNNIHYLTFEDYHNNIDHYILYDGDNLYFFSDSVNLTIKGENITLSPLSYVVASSKEFNYYDYETDTYKSYENISSITLSNEYYTINVSEDYVEYQTEKMLLPNDLSFLTTLKEEKK